MSMKSLLASTALGVALLGAPLSASAENPFGNAQREVLTADSMQKVVGTSYYGQLYGYYGLYYGAYAQLYGSIAFYNVSKTYYSYAYQNAYSSYYYFYYAWYYT